MAIAFIIILIEKSFVAKIDWVKRFGYSNQVYMKDLACFIFVLNICQNVSMELE